MSYAQVADVKARAGRLAPAWDANTVPGDTEIGRLLDDVAAEIDAILSGAGFPTPVVTDPAQGALRQMNANGALAALIAGTFPAGSSNAAAETLRTQVKDEYDKAMATLLDGTHPAIAALHGTSAAASASDFWSENPDYGKPWSPYVDSIQTNPYLAPTIAKTDKF